MPRQAQYLFILLHLFLLQSSVRENYLLYLLQVKELQSKVSALVKEKTAIMLLKSEIEDQHKILAAQLKAKVTV